MTYEVVDSDGTRAYDTSSERTKHLVFPQKEDEPYKPPVYIDTLEADIHGQPIEDIRFYRPDENQIALTSDIPALNHGGVMTIGDDYYKLGIAMAQRGRKYTTYRTNRDQLIGGVTGEQLLQNVPILRSSERARRSVHGLLKFSGAIALPMVDRRHRDPFLRTSQNGHEVAKAIRQHAGVEQIDIVEHSYGGMTGSELAAFEAAGSVRNVIAIDIAGLIKGALKAHVRGVRGMGSEGIEVARHFMQEKEELPENFVDHQLDHITDNPILAFREIKALMFDPDAVPYLRQAREKGVRVGGVFYARSAFFALLAVQAANEKRKIFDKVVVDENARHVKPLIEPDATAETLIKMTDDLTKLHDAA